MSNTSQTIANMLTENTGINFLDSGGETGRSWQQNQGRDFKAEPKATLSFKYGVDVTLNVYHWLDDRLTSADDLDARFQVFAAKHADEYPMNQVALFLDSLADESDEHGGTFDPPTGIYGEGKPCGLNTYNGESLLSQVIQFTYFTWDFTSYVALQIHGGADVRGGYTGVRFFEANESMFDYAHAYIGCENGECHANWSTDDANNWYNEGACGLGAGTQLEAYDRTKEDDGEVWTKGKVHVLSNGDGLCPHCGSLLKAFAHPAS